MSFFFPLKFEKALYDQGYRYDVIYYCRKCPTQIRVTGGLYQQAKTIDGAKKTIQWLRRCGNWGDYEVREHIFPWDSFFIRMKKRLRGVIYYEDDRKIARDAYRKKLKELKDSMGGVQ
jgi:hypothetical protein